MAKQGKRRRFTVLALAGLVFLFHHLGILTTLIITISTLAALWVILGLVIDVRPVRRILGKLLRMIERRWSNLCEQMEHQGTGSWHM